MSKFVYDTVKYFWTWVRFPPSPPDKDNYMKNSLKIKRRFYFFYVVSVLLLISTLIFGYLYFKEKNDVSVNNDSQNENVSSEIDNDPVTTTRTCSEKEIKDSFETSGIASIALEKNNSKISLVTSEYENIDGILVEPCEYEITDKILLTVEKEDLQFLTNFVYLSKSFVAYNFNGQIFLQDLTKTSKPKAVVSREMIKGTKIYNDGIAFEVIGPFTNSYTADQQFYFYTNITWGCEGDQTYCNQMSKKVGELESKKLLGFFQYNYLINTRTFLK